MKRRREGKAGWKKGEKRGKEKGINTSSEHETKNRGSSCFSTLRMRVHFCWNNLELSGHGELYVAFGLWKIHSELSKLFLSKVFYLSYIAKQGWSYSNLQEDDDIFS